MNRKISDLISAGICSAGIILGYPSTAEASDSVLLSFDLPEVDQASATSQEFGSKAQLRYFSESYFENRPPLPNQLPPLGRTPSQAPLPPPPQIPLQSSVRSSIALRGEMGKLFAGGSQSLLAIAIGTAEGTRLPGGDRTAAYWGHVDPGNGVWNLGSFSYQHGANSPEEADQKQLTRLQQQATALQQQAIAKSVQLTTEMLLNGLDLANQSPEAALSVGGYIDRLHEAQAMGLQGNTAIHWARTRAFLDPNSGQWDAPGLGNQVGQISADQERRMKAIAEVLERSQAGQPGKQRINSHEEVAAGNGFAAPTPTTETTKINHIVDHILSLDLPY